VVDCDALNRLYDLQPQEFLIAKVGCSRMVSVFPLRNRFFA
jgi:hypothetical protein